MNYYIKFLKQSTRSIITKIFHLKKNNYFNFFSLDVEKMSNLGDIFYSLIYTFIIVGLIDLVITLYVIFYKNNPVIEVARIVCYHCANKKLPMAGALYLFPNVLFIFLNQLSNGYYKLGSLERSYGVWPTGQLLQIDYLKIYLGKNFNYSEIIDVAKRVDFTKLKVYAQKNPLKNDINFQIFTDLAASKSRNS
jgi:hypothetical protein